MFTLRISPQIAAFSMILFLSLTWLFFHSTSPSLSSQRCTPSTYLQHSSSRDDTHPIVAMQPNLYFEEPSDDTIRDIQNRTLGFQKIYAISMPHRTDKRDYLSLMGLVSDIEITFIDGVNGSEMHPDAIPTYWKGNVTVGEHGCWRAHMNIYQHMVQQRIQSALVLEDDADWDILLRPQLVDFARGMRALQSDKTPAPRHSPYGDDWNILAIGHTGINNRLNIDQQYWVTRNDPTVISSSLRTWSREPSLSAPALRGEHTRIAMQVSKLTGTAAYAILLQGAARMLHDQALLPNAAAIDGAISNLCHHNLYSNSTPFCYGTYPMLIGRYRAIGPKARDSDRRTSSNEAEPGSGGGQSTEDRLEPESEFSVFPVSLNMKTLLSGESVVLANDLETDMVKKLDLRTFEFPKGEVMWVGKGEDVKEVQEQSVVV